ncbi:hypothetical protein BT96DRAFT_521466 [Gymnopus androsaceus JB14]|uniref:Uncharacterized protein n=1 Tax=Gymnopus androsaceus JB14 TaxID=1447944 RepID=A0A6A4HWH4_9AGAR|nr:hypothetical protein BT96DRAFT_521466 [Gymnopus androsaceus JB14]
MNSAEASPMSTSGAEAAVYNVGKPLLVPFQLLNLVAAASTFGEQSSNRGPPNPHANRYQEPTVGHGSHDWKLQGVFRHGAFSAVGGDQVIKTVSSSATYPVALSSYPNANPNPNPSVLPEFHHRDRRHPNAHDRGVTFGEGSFSAVSGHSRITNRNGLLRAHTCFPVNPCFPRRTVTQPVALLSSFLAATVPSLDTMVLDHMRLMC